MTTLDKRAVRRETNVPDTTRSGRRPFIVLLEVGGKLLRIKPKGTRRWYSVDYASIYRLGVKIRAAELQEERKQRRADAKRKSKGGA
jgi:hypothetical protein